MPITILCQAAPVFSQRKSIAVLSPHSKKQIILKYLLHFWSYAIFIDSKFTISKV